MKKIIAKLLVATMFCSILPMSAFAAEQPKEEKPQTHSAKKERKEVIEKRTETSKTYQNPDGTMTTELYQSPIHYKDSSSKQWNDFDNTLEEDQKTQKIKNEDNVFDVEFSEKMVEGTAVVEVEEGASSISLSPVSAGGEGEKPKNPTAKVNKNKITYEEAFDHTDLSYTVGNQKVKEDIILKEKPATGETVVYSFALNLKGLTYEVQKDGRILFKDKKTQDPLYYLEKPYMYDSYKPEGFSSFSDTSVPEGSLSYEVDMKVKKKGNQLLIDVIPDQKWLMDENRVYPVTIDPTIVKYQPVTELIDTNVRSALPTQTGGTDLDLGAGLHKNASTTNVIRSLLKFDIPTFPAGVRVIDAELNLWASSVWNDTSINLDLHPVTSSWEENYATWNQRKASTSWVKSGGDFNTTKFSTQLVGALGSSFESNHYKWSITPSYMEQILSQPNQNLGFLLKSASEGTASYKKFYSGDNLDYAGYSPLLAITYVSNSRLGLEDYWTYNNQPLADGEISVNLGTGNGVVQFTDFDISGRGGSGISFGRTYNTKASEADAFGPGWSFTGSESITESTTTDQTITYTDRDGTVHLFPYNTSTGMYQSPAGTYLTLVKDGTDGYKLTDKYGNVSRHKKIAQDTHTAGYTIAKLEYEQDRNGNTISYTYNTKGNVTGITDASGRKMTINYGASGISNITFEGKKVTYHYTFEGQLKEVRKYKDTTNYVSTFFAYDPSNGKLDTITDANGKITTFIYENGFVKSIQQPSTTGTSIPVTEYAYNIAAYTSDVTDPNGGITKYQMNNNYVIKSVKDPVNGPIEYVSMDANYNPTQIKDGKGYITNRTYDAKGNLLEEKDPNNNTTSYTYDSYSNVKTVTDIKGTTTYTYNTKGDLIGITDPAGSLTEFGYDAYGNKTSAFFPDGSKEFYTYDVLNNYQNTSVDLLGRTTVTVTDSLGNVTSVKEPKGYTTFFGYDQRQLLTSVKDAKNGSTSYGYDENGNMTTVTNAAGKIVTMTYNDQNQVTSREEPMGETTFLSYDNNGNVVSIKKPTEGNQTVLIENQYDKANQLKSVSADGVKKWSYTYDANGQTETVKDETTLLTKNIDYYENGNLKSETKGSQSIVYGYNDANQLTSAKLGSNGVFIDQGYELDANGQLENLYRDGFKLANLTYTKTGLPDKVTYTNGIVSDADYDQVQQLDTLSVENGTTSLLSESFDYDDNGNITDVFSSQGNRSYTYDELNQLKSQTLPDGTVESYEYDSVGNRTKKTKVKNGQTDITTYGYNSNDQLITINGQPYIYDKSGNRKQDTHFIYEYNDFYELTAIKDLSGQTIATYKYDEQGRRISKTVNRQTTNYHYGQGIEVLFETDSAGSIMTEYSYDQRGFPLTMTKNGQTYYYVLNGHNDVITLTDSAGNVVASYEYDAWGNILTQSGVMSEVNPYRYAGYQYDEESKLYYLSTRYYNASEGTFLTKDRFVGYAKEPLSLNKYSYNQGDPVNYIDPEGEARKKAHPSANDWFMRTVDTNEKYAVDHRYNIKWFYDHVRNKGPWDYKQKLSSKYTLFGKAVSGADIGNIHYGYIGSAFGFGPKLLLSAAGVAQIKAGTSGWEFWASRFDDPRDQEMIKWGIELYRQLRKYSAPIRYI